MGETRWLRVPVAEITYVKSIYEAYDGLCTVTSPSAARGELVLWVAPGHEALADELEQRLAQEAGLQRLPSRAP